MKKIEIYTKENIKEKLIKEFKKEFEDLATEITETKITFYSNNIMKIKESKTLSKDKNIDTKNYNNLLILEYNFNDTSVFSKHMMLAITKLKDYYFKAGKTLIKNNELIYDKEKQTTIYDGIKLLKENINQNINDEDEKRIIKNISYLNSKEMVFNKYDLLIPSKNNTKLMAKNEIFELLINTFAMSHIAYHYKDRDIEPDQVKMFRDMINYEYPFLNIENAQAKIILRGMEENDKKINKEAISYMYNECTIYLWALGLKEFPSAEELADPNEIDSYLFFNMNNKNCYSDFFIQFADLKEHKLDLSMMMPKSYEEILDMADLLNRYKYCFENNDEKAKNINIISLQFQLKAISTILNWNINKKITD